MTVQLQLLISVFPSSTCIKYQDIENHTEDNAEASEVDYATEGSDDALYCNKFILLKHYS